MARKPRLSKGRKMVPNYFVFCEGETEVAYIEALRAHFRKPVHIIVRKADNNLTDAYIARSKQEYIQTDQDRTFVLFDLDVPGVWEHLQTLTNVTLICSNPCFEVWFLMHFADVPQALSTEECLRKLKQAYPNYRKGEGDMGFYSELMARMPELLARLEKKATITSESISGVVKAPINPSCNMPELLKVLAEL